ncbi:hypothetical protein MPH_07491, partial [Macrophomina phaseolina MS6]
IRFFRLLIIISTIIITLLRILLVSRVKGYSVSAFKDYSFTARLRGISLLRTYLLFVYITVDLRRKVYYLLKGK